MYKKVQYDYAQAEFRIKKMSGADIEEVECPFNTVYWDVPKNVTDAYAVIGFYNHILSVYDSKIELLKSNKKRVKKAMKKFIRNL